MPYEIIAGCYERRRKAIIYIRHLKIRLSSCRSWQRVSILNIDRLDNLLLFVIEVSASPQVTNLQGLNCD